MFGGVSFSLASLRPTEARKRPAMRVAQRRELVFCSFLALVLKSALGDRIAGLGQTR
jgi:hypothetical protein